MVINLASDKNSRLLDSQATIHHLYFLLWKISITNKENNMMDFNELIT